MEKNNDDKIWKTFGDGKDKYYVYALCDEEGIPFYIGKGENKRVLQHEEDCKNYTETINNIKNDSTIDKDEKEKQIDEIQAISEKFKAIKKLGEKYQPVIIKYGLNEQEAYMCESALINMYSFMAGDNKERKDKEVTLQKLTNIVNGHASNMEKASKAIGLKTKARTLQDFSENCALERIDIMDIENPVVFIKLNELYEPDMNPDELTDATRGLWTVAQDRYEYLNGSKVICLYDNIIKCVYNINNILDNQEKNIGKFMEYPKKLRNIEKELYFLDELKMKIEFEKANEIVPKELNEWDEFWSYEVHEKNNLKDYVKKNGSNQAINKIKTTVKNLRKKIFFDLSGNEEENILLNKILVCKNDISFVAGECSVFYNFDVNGKKAKIRNKYFYLNKHINKTIKSKVGNTKETIRDNQIKYQQRIKEELDKRFGLKENGSVEFKIETGYFEYNEKSSKPKWNKCPELNYTIKLSPDVSVEDIDKFFEEI